MKPKIIKKAWKINTESLSEPWFYDDVKIFAIDRNLAMKELKGHYKYYELRDLAEDILEQGDYKHESPYLILKGLIVRDKKHDVVLFDGVEMDRLYIDRHIYLKEREQGLRQLLVDNPDAHAYMLKDGWYYAQSRCGYVTREKAGLFTMQEAVEEALSCDKVTVKLRSVTEHNEMLDEAIAELVGRKILPAPKVVHEWSDVKLVELTRNRPSTYLLYTLQGKYGGGFGYWESHPTAMNEGDKIQEKFDNGEYAS